MSTLALDAQTRIRLASFFCQTAEKNLKRAGPCPFAIGSQFGAGQAQRIRDRHSTKVRWAVVSTAWGARIQCFWSQVGRQARSRQGLTLDLESVS